MTVRHPIPESYPQSFVDLIDRTILDYHLLEPGDKIGVAVSGGPDSVALLRSLLTLQDHHGITIGVAHLNHMLRGEESLRDEAFVETLARKFGLAFHTRQKDVNAWAKKNRCSVEEAGRELRYDFFNGLCDRVGYTKIATGHTKNDNAELVLMNLIRGAGPRGLSGIPPKRDNRIIRPLIRATKDQILLYLKTENQSYMVDSTNEDTIYLRNRIRHGLMPYLKEEYNPEIMAALDRLSSILRQEEDYFNLMTKKAATNCIISEAPSCIIFSKSLLADLHPALFSRVIRSGIKKVKQDLKRISHTHINDIAAFCETTSPGTSLDLPGRIRVYKNRDTLIIKKEKMSLRELGKKEKQNRADNPKKANKQAGAKPKRNLDP